MQNLSYVDFLLTNNVYAFQQTIAICSGFSDCHKFVLTILKPRVPRNQPKQTAHQKYKQLDSSKSKNKMKSVLTKENIDSCTMFDE